MYVIGFDIGEFFKNLTTLAQKWAGYFVAFLGLVLIVWGIVMIVKAFVSHGRGQTNWLLCAGMILVGGFLFAGGTGGFTNVVKLADVGNDTISQLGSSGGT